MLDGQKSLHASRREALDAWDAEIDATSSPARSDHVIVSREQREGDENPPGIARTLQKAEAAEAAAKSKQPKEPIPAAEETSAAGKDTMTEQTCMSKAEHVTADASATAAVTPQRATASISVPSPVPLST